MNTPIPSRHLILGSALLVGALSASALTLGRVRGATLIGRPLDVVIQVGVDAGEDAATVCAEAEVFQGDFRMDGSRVTTQVVPGASAREVGVRVRTLVTVDEPVVTVYLRAGCGDKITRRYVLLADIPAEVAPPVITLPSVAAAPVAPRAAAPAAPTRAPAPVAGATAAPVSPAAPAVPAVATAVPLPAATAKAVPPVAPPSATAKVDKPAPPAKAEKSARADKPAKAEKPIKAEKPTRAQTRSRLKLEPLDLTIERDPVLRASTELLSAPTVDEAARKQAAALWRAINAQPQDVLRDSQRLETLQAEFQALQRASAANDVALGEVRTQLKVAQDQRYANGLVYALAALLLALAGLAGYFWLRWRRADAHAPDWWQSPEAFRGVTEERNWGAGATPAADASADADDAAVDLDLGLNEPARLPLPPEAVVVPSRYAGSPSDFAASMLGSPRAVNVEELFDIQQQADFFVSLGQHDQAIEVLRNHISENAETSALAYLDLLKIYHAIDRRDDYARLRDDFNKVFNAQVPQFDGFTDKGSGLEMYQNALARVEALWPSAKVLEIIEESIFRKPGQGGGEAFDLEAYHELLLLYAIAKDIVDQGESSLDLDLAGGVSLPSLDSSLRPSFSQTSIQPLSTKTREASAGGGAGAAQGGESFPVLEAPWASPRMGLDIDLTEAASATSAFMEIGLEPPPSERPEHPGRSSSPPPAAAPDNNLIDFDLFDDDTERAIAPKRSDEPKP